MKLTAALLALVPMTRSAMGTIVYGGGQAPRGGGSPLDVCDEQYNCVVWTINEVAGGPCGQCGYKICMKVDFTVSNECVDNSGNPLEGSGTTFSNTCKKPQDQCVENGIDFSDATEETSGLGQGYMQCQFVEPGEYADFSLKAGNNMSPGSGENGCGSIGVPGDDFICGDLQSANSCNSSPGQCYWRIKAPSGPPDCGTGGGGGDPHFQRWNQKRDSFHGECDLVMVKSEAFHNHAGFDLHARTTIADFYSYIESGAFRVGDTVVELSENNSTLTARNTPTANSLLPLVFRYTISVKEHVTHNLKKEIEVDLHGQSKVVFKFYKHYLTIAMDGVSGDLADAVGLLGEFPTGNMYSRDGQAMTDFEQMGFEWQVNPEDPKLFREDRSPQLPFEPCRMPTAARPARRNLRATDGVLLDQAKQACAHLTQGDYELCLDDVMITGDVGLAQHAW